MSPTMVRRFVVPARLGTVIGSAFGAVFVLANSGTPLPSVVGWLLRFAGLAALLCVLWLQATHPPAAGHRIDGRRGFGAAFWLVVVAEVVVGELGLAVMHSADAPWQANVAWVATVVGAHFGVLAWTWQEAGLRVVAALLLVVGILGLLLASTATAVAWIPVVSGVSSGLVLLSGGLVASMTTQGPRS